MGKVRRDLTGQLFGRISVLSLNRQIENIGTVWNCKCRCGNLVERTTETLTRGKPEVKRCGQCYDESKYASEYGTWKAMMQRCYNKDNEWYHRYGGRGITVCDSWRADFLNFLQDMGRRPEPELSIERKNNDGNYEKSNCCWATKSQQSYNRS